jgi:hypothetical protein
LGNFGPFLTLFGFATHVYIRPFQATSNKGSRVNVSLVGASRDPRPRHLSRLQFYQSSAVSPRRAKRARKPLIPLFIPKSYSILQCGAKCSSFGPCSIKLFGLPLAFVGCRFRHSSGPLFGVVLALGFHLSVQFG